MQLEYVVTAIDLLDTEFAKIINDQINKLPSIQTIVVPHFFLRTAITNAPNKNISCLIDYPLGISDLKTRQTAATSAIKSGAKYLDITLPSLYLSNRKYDKIRDDIKMYCDLIDKNNIRYILEYRIFNHHSLKKICEILMSFGIDHISTSSGYRLDNLSDFIIASQFLQHHFPKLKIILSANYWNERHFDMILEQNFVFARSESIEILQDLSKKLNKV